MDILEKLDYIIFAYLIYLLYEFILKKSTEKNKIRKFVVFFLFLSYLITGLIARQTLKNGKNYKADAYEIVQVEEKNYAVLEELPRLNRFVVAEIIELTDRSIAINLNNLKLVERTNKKIMYKQDIEDVIFEQ